MSIVQITETFYAPDRQAWRAWLGQHHNTHKEIWLIYYSKDDPRPTIPYLDAVEEALCFGWIDGIDKRMDPERRAQRFTPRRPKSHWTELNKERARRLIAAGLMTEAGARILPDLSVAAFRIPDDILKAIQEDPQTWANFQAFPAHYQRIRVGFIDEVRSQPEVFQKRMVNFLTKTRQNKMFGQLE
jgi:uncharacterized protein YdeI (YjbR/CyaY-like superfamily)